MFTIAAFSAIAAGLAAFINTVSRPRMAHRPANVLCDRMLTDIGQNQYREMREAVSTLSHRGGRFP